MKLPQESSVHYPILLFVIMLGLATRVNPTVLNGMGRNSIWFIFVCFGLVMIGIWMSLKVHALNGAETLKAGGNGGLPWPLRITYIIYSFYFIGMSSIYCYLSGDFLSRALLFGEPKTYIVLEAILAVLGALFPLKTQARYAHIMMIFAVPFFFLICLAPTLHAQWSWINPIFNTEEITAPLNSIAVLFPIFSPLAVIALMRKGKEDINGTSIALFTLVITLFTSYIIMMGIVTFGMVRAKDLIYFVYSIINAVRVENFVLERIVFIWMLYWKYIQIIGCTFFIRCAARAVAGVLGKQTSVFFIVGVGTFSGIIAVWIAKPPLNFKFFNGMGYFSIVMLLVMPAVLWMILRNRRAAI